MFKFLFFVNFLFVNFNSKTNFATTYFVKGIDVGVSSSNLNQPKSLQEMVKDFSFIFGKNNNFKKLYFSKIFLGFSVKKKLFLCITWQIVKNLHFVLQIKFSFNKDQSKFEMILYAGLLISSNNTKNPQLLTGYLFITKELFVF